MPNYLCVIIDFYLSVTRSLVEVLNSQLQLNHSDLKKISKT